MAGRSQPRSPGKNCSDGGATHLHSVTDSSFCPVGREWLPEIKSLADRSNKPILRRMDIGALVNPGKEGSVSPAGVDDGTYLRNLLPRLQITDESSPSKPDNYRISPATPQSVGISPATPASSASDKASTTIESVLKDWSGRGSHVDFLPNETVPLTQGRFLGHGSMGGVYETTVNGHVFAWKKIYCRRKIGDKEKKEIQILKKISHKHIIKFAGSYTHGQFLGFLLHPVAVCDLATLLEDVEAAWVRAEDATQRDRLSTFGFDVCDESRWEYGMFFYPKAGCIVRAVEYLHQRKIRHKDLKPSNILLSPNGLWLTDFGTATDFSLQTVSTTDNQERGTPKYFAPEVASYKPNGRAADIFSLGCVMLEIWTICEFGDLLVLRENRTDHDKSFQANLPQIRNLLNDWRSNERYLDENILISIIYNMLKEDPDHRPFISQVSTILSSINTGRDDFNFFGDCCREEFISTKEHKEKLAEQKARSEETISQLKRELALSQAANASYVEYQKQVKDLLKEVQPDSVSPEGDSNEFDTIQLQKIKDEMVELRKKNGAYTEIVGNEHDMTVPRLAKDSYAKYYNRVREIYEDIEGDNWTRRLVKVPYHEIAGNEHNLPAPRLANESYATYQERVRYMYEDLEGDSWKRRLVSRWGYPAIGRG